ncbi:MAG: hypothetical protein H6650_05285 [Ardenticatenales bacterium]|nr:hypothetical protein [Ardenticatenales bacterium]
MGDLILQTRLDALRSNLEQVQRVLDAVRGQRDEIERLQTLLAARNDSIQAFLDEALYSLGNARIALDRLSRRADLHPDDQTVLDNAQDDLNNSEEQLRGVLAHLGSATTIISARRKRFIELDDQSDLGKTLGMTLIRPAERWSKDLDAIQQKIAAAAAEEALSAQTSGPAQAAHGAAAARLRGEVWAELNNNTAAQIKPIFAEYVDFLRGVALRDMGLDAGICQVADELVRRFRLVPNTNWESFTILARDEAVDKTLANIIRLPFPEWTVWALPLVAHEFGHLVSYSTDVHEFLTARVSADWPVLILQDCLADAFATYAMGPSYALSLILLRLNPLRAFQDGHDQAAHAKRAFVILTMLDWMNRRNPMTPYTPIIQTLRTEWDTALPATTPTEALTNDQKTLLTEMVEFLGDFLDAHAKVDYTITAWNSVADWPPLLAQGPNAAITLNPEHELRDVLNAAWQSRLLFPEKRNEIAAAAIALWERILNPPPSRGRAGRTQVGITRRGG